MKTILALVTLLGSLMFTFAVVFPQNSNTTWGSNALGSANAVNSARARNRRTRNRRTDANFPCDPNVNSTVGCNPNVNWSKYWGYETAANCAINATGNDIKGLVNAYPNSVNFVNAIRPNKPRKRTRRPAMGASMTLDNSFLAMLRAGVR